MPLPSPGEPVGRQWLEALGLGDAEVSSRHLVFSRQRGGALELTDAGSRNGTWVDAARIAAGEVARIADGATIRIGRTLLVYRERFSGPLAPSAPLGGMVGPFGLRGVAEAVAALVEARPGNVLIVGETGTGKELAAAFVARELGRGPPVPVNLGAVSSGVFESQLFGHVQGAFSDARKSARGIVASAEGGAVFLDEIGELPLELQPKLLRLLENREVQPVGAERPSKVDVLLLAATNRDLASMVEVGGFRRDLHARLCSAVISLPPLRDRMEDVFALLQALAAARGEELVESSVEIEALERLMQETFAANVRELASLFARVRVIDRAPGLRLWSLQEVLGQAPVSAGRALTTERVQQVLAESGGNESEAARRLGVSRGALRRFLATKR